MNIYYGIDTYKINVTSICFNKLIKEDIILIPANDVKRSSFFSDPLPGKLKSIYIRIGNTIIIYDHLTDVLIDTKNNQIYTDNVPEYIYKIYPELKLFNIHKQLKIEYGSFTPLKI